ncbi:hypothetical protein [Cognatiyoonia koreensis]|nr:hypothetical protein [Cognatiyoonia koreensis]
MPRFVIDTGDIDMSKEDVMLLQSDLQSTTLGHIAKLGYEKPWVTKFPRHWYGIILHPDLQGIPGLEEDIGKRLELGR